MAKFPLTILRVERDTNQGKTLIGRGVMFPSEYIVMEWRNESYPPEDRLEKSHQSIYHSFDDLKEATGSSVVVETEV